MLNPLLFFLFPPLFEKGKKEKRGEGGLVTDI